MVSNNALPSTKSNKSLDASGVSTLVIDNLSVTWLSPAASTQPLSLAAFEIMGRSDVLARRRSSRHRARRGCGRGSDRVMWSHALHSVEWFGPFHSGGA